MEEIILYIHKNFINQNVSLSKGLILVIKKLQNYFISFVQNCHLWAMKRTFRKKYEIF